MTYCATEIAKFIIDHCNSTNRSISNLHLQKMLSFLWIDYYKETGERLFLNDICAWKLGPVVPDVYYEYCEYAGRAIAINCDSAIDQDDRQKISKLLQKYIGQSASALVNLTHQPGTAWDRVYRGGIGDRQPIPFDLIISLGFGG